MSEFVINKTRFGNTEACDSCGCEVATKGFDWGPPFTEKHETEKRFLCEVCASTIIGNITRRECHNYDRVVMARMIAQVANLIITKINGNDEN